MLVQRKGPEGSCLESQARMASRIRAPKLSAKCQQAFAAKKQSHPGLLDPGERSLGLLFGQEPQSSKELAEGGHIVKEVGGAGRSDKAQLWPWF